MSYYAIYTILYVMYLHIQLIPGGNQTPRDIDACRPTTMEDGPEKSQEETIVV